MLRQLKTIRKSNYVILAIAAVVYFSNVMFTHPAPKPDWGSYAGSAACASCHKDIYESHIKTAHYLDSKPASTEFIKGSFAEGKNKFVYNKWMEVLLEKKNNGFFQTAYMNGFETQSEPFDIVIGSGRKGQTYLYWNDGKLFQLPVSYYTPLNSWCNSPGYTTNFIKFDRMIPAQCLECHGTYAEAKEENSITTYDKSHIIYGIDCERCHGPSAEHVNFHKEHPAEKTGKYTINIKQLTRQQRLDGCALCHSGFRDALQPAFSFQTGNKLDEFSRARYNNDSTAGLDVHGNQYGLLTASKCFQLSQMDCSSCHDVHKNEVNSPALFSQRCMTCHTDTKHTSLSLPAEKQLLLKDNCIDCHMPMLQSKNILLGMANAGKLVPDEVRTHRVAIYKEKTKEFLKKMK